jgi:hypothetical protein
MFNRAEFLQALEDNMTSIDRADVWALLGYLLVMGPCSRSALRHAFWPAQGAFNAHLHMLVKLHAVELQPDKWDGEPLVRVHPHVVAIAQSVNHPKEAKPA